MRYAQRVRIHRSSGGGTQDEETGGWTPGGSADVYNGPADVQDQPRALSYADGRPTQTSDAEVYLADPGAVPLVRIGDLAEVTWEDGSTMDARVIRTERLSSVLFLERL